MAAVLNLDPIVLTDKLYAKKPNLLNPQISISLYLFSPGLVDGGNDLVHNRGIRQLYQTLSYTESYKIQKRKERTVETSPS
jgi:hypothetical protein